MNKCKSILTIDEQTSQGSLGSLIMENCSSKAYIKTMSLPYFFIFKNIGRDKLLDKYGFSLQEKKSNLLKI